MFIDKYFVGKSATSMYGCGFLLVRVLYELILTYMWVRSYTSSLWRANVLTRYLVTNIITLSNESTIIINKNKVYQYIKQDEGRSI